MTQSKGREALVPRASLPMLHVDIASVRHFSYGVTTVVRTLSIKQAWARQSLFERLIIAYSGMYLVLAAGRRRGLVPGKLLSAAGMPIFVHWLVSVVRLLGSSLAGRRRG